MLFLHCLNREFLNNCFPGPYKELTTSTADRVKQLQMVIENGVELLESRKNQLACVAFVLNALDLGGFDEVNEIIKSRKETFAFLHKVPGLPHRAIQALCKLATRVDENGQMGALLTPTSFGSVGGIISSFKGNLTKFEYNGSLRLINSLVEIKKYKTDAKELQGLIIYYHGCKT